MSKIDILDEAAKLHEKTVDDIVNEQNVSSDYFEFKYENKPLQELEKNLLRQSSLEKII